jgi:hypothetical protein
MALSDCELLGCSVGLAESNVVFKSRTLDYMIPTCDGEKKLRRHIQLHIWAYPFFAVFVMKESGVRERKTLDFAGPFGTVLGTCLSDWYACFKLQVSADVESFVYTRTQPAVDARSRLPRRSKETSVNTVPIRLVSISLSLVTRDRLRDLHPALAPRSVHSRPSSPHATTHRRPLHSKRQRAPISY